VVVDSLSVVIMVVDCVSVVSATELVWDGVIDVVVVVVVVVDVVIVVVVVVDVDLVDVVVVVDDADAVDVDGDVDVVNVVVVVVVVDVVEVVVIVVVVVNDVVDDNMFDEIKEAVVALSTGFLVSSIVVKITVVPSSILGAAVSVEDAPVDSFMVVAS